MENKNNIKDFYYLLEKKVSKNLRIYQNSNYDKNKYDSKELENLLNFLSYKDEEVISFICCTINLYKESIYHLYEQKEEKFKKELVKKIKNIYSQKKEPIVYRELTEFNFKKLCENYKEEDSYQNKKNENQNIENIIIENSNNNLDKNNNNNNNNLNNNKYHISKIQTKKKFKN